MALSKREVLESQNPIAKLYALEAEKVIDRKLRDWVVHQSIRISESDLNWENELAGTSSLLFRTVIRDIIILTYREKDWVVDCLLESNGKFVFTFS